MNSPRKFSLINRSRIASSVLVALLAVALFLLAPVLRAREGAAPVGGTGQSTAETAVSAAWQQAQDAGSYIFSADVTQTTIPLATVTNVGRTSREERYYLEGETSRPDRRLHLTLRGDLEGLPPDGVEILMENGETRARTGDGEWESGVSFAPAFLPDGDFMAFLVAATDIQADGVESRRGVTFTRYTFAIDGAKFARYLRDQTQAQLAAAGELPPGVELHLSPVYRDMHGRGELWVDTNGYPLRQKLNLRFPDDGNTRTEAAMVVDFSDFGQIAPLPDAESGPVGEGITAVSAQTGQFLIIYLLPGTAVFALFVVLLAGGRSRLAYRTITYLFILSLVITPFLQGQQAAAFFTEHASPAPADSETAAAARQFLQKAAGPDVKPSTGGQSTLHLIRQDGGLDTDQDGYSDVQEYFLGTDPTADSLLVDPDLARALNPQAPNANGDDDGDGLTNQEELLLGTSSSTEDLDFDGFADGIDTDGDGITDTLEIEGFQYAGQTWYLDPNEPDSNFDFIGDGFECDAEGSTLTCVDRDNDAVPDAFDEDNDGDGVPDRVDLSPNSSHSFTFDRESPMELSVNGLLPGKLNYVEFHVRPENPDRLWYAFNVLDWPQEELGQMQEHDEVPYTFYDYCAANLGAGQSTMDECWPKDANGDVKLVPMLEIVVPQDSQVLPAAADYTNYGITVQRLNSSGDSVAYVPLQLVNDPDGDSRVAFYGKMLYRPQQNEWGSSHRVRLVWVIQALVDGVCADANCSSIVDNQLQVIHTYHDSWRLTGFNVREDHGADVAVIYEEPAEDGDLGNEGHLMLLANHLDHTLLAARDCDLETSDGTCIVDGAVDVDLPEIERRFNHDTNTGVSDRLRWGLPDVFSVESAGYRHVDEALMTTAMTETSRILSENFTAVWTPAAPITPTLMVAREERFRETNLDVTLVDSSVRWLNNALRVDFDAGGGTPVSIVNALSWAPYAYDDLTGAWQPHEMGRYTELLDARFTAEAVDLGLNPDDEIVSGQIYLAVLYYLSLNKGWSSLTQLIPLDENGNRAGNSVLLNSPQNARSDLRLEGETGSVLRGGRAAGVKVVNDAVLWRIARKTSIYKYLGKTRNLIVASRTINAAGSSGNTLAKTTLKDIGTEDTLRGLRTKFKNAFGRNSQARGSGLAAVGVIAVGLTGAILYFATEPGSTANYIGAAMLGVATAAILVGAPVLATKAAYGQMRVANIGKAEAVKSLLKSRATLVGQTAKANVVGLVLDIGITWGIFIYTVESNNLDPGSVEFNAVLAAAIAATFIAILFFLLSFSTVGFIIVSLIVVIDLIALFFCGGGDDCFSISGTITEAIAGLLYSYESTINFDLKDSNGDPVLVQWRDFDYRLADPELGMQAGNRMRFEADVRNWLYHKAPSDSGAIGQSRFSADAIRKSTFRNYLETDSSNPAAVNQNQMNNDWDVGYWYTQKYTIVYLFATSTAEVDLYYARNDDSVYTYHTLAADINAVMPLYYKTSLNVPGYDCWLDFCDDVEIENEDVTDVGQNLRFDVYPADVDGFYAWNWDELFTQYADPSDPATAYVAVDHDGDGLRAAIVGGNDPNDSVTACSGGLCWDTDGDGLSDPFELELRQGGGTAVNPQLADTDGDGLSDRREYQLRTNPAVADTDGDGLTDPEEVNGWAFTYAANKTTVVTSDPLDVDTDGDGLDDMLEKSLHEQDWQTFPYHPQVVNPNPLAISVDTSSLFDAFKPGDTIVYTTTIRNGFDANYYAQGTVTTTWTSGFATDLYPEPFNLFRAQEKQIVHTVSVPAGSASQTAVVGNDATATLRAAASGTSPSVGSVTVVETHPVLIDNDAPTAVMSTPAFVMPGGVRIIGGEATDPTSNVSTVEIRINNGPWEAANGAESWAYAWQVPDTPGSYTLRVRATDVVGNVQSAPTVYTVQVDDTPPVVTADPAYQGNPVVAASRTASGAWTVPMTGTAGDALAGVRGVEARLEPNGGGWQPAHFYPLSNTWSIDYELNLLTENGVVLPESTDQYTVTVRANDLALENGNVVTTTFPLRIDNSAPEAAINRIGKQDVLSGTVYVLDTRPVTQSEVINGTVIDAGPVGAGVAQVEIAFAPIDFVQSQGEPELMLLFDELPGAELFHDASGQGHVGICPAGQCPTTDQPGRIGKAVLFDNGEQDYVDFPNLDLPETGYSAALWFNTTCADCGLLAADQGVLGNQGHDRDLYLSGGNLCAYVAGGGPICSTGTDYADGRWHSAVQVLGDQGHKLYADGVLAAESGLTASTFTAQTGLNVGHSLQAATPFYDGLLDEITIFPLQLSAAAVAGHFNSWTAILPTTTGAISTTWQYTVPEGLEGLYQIDLAATDAVGNRNDNRATWEQWRGEIDTLAPRVSIEKRFGGAGSTAQTHYVATAVDANLSDARLASPCPVKNEDYHYDSDGRLVEITSACSVDGWQQEPVFFRACDRFGHCAAAYPDQVYLYYTQPDGIARVPLAGNSTTQEMIQTLVHGRVRPHGIGLDVQNGKVYWGEFGPGTTTGGIYRANLDGSAVEPLITGLLAPPVDTAISSRPPQRFGFALDVDANKMYWTQTETGEIWRANLDGSGAEVLVDVWSLVSGTPRLFALTLDLSTPQIYWVQGRNASPYGIEIWRAGINGESPQAIYTTGTFVDGIAVDPAAGRVYWTETVDPHALVMQANLDGTNPQILHQGAAADGQLNFGPLALEPVADLLYWRSGVVVETDINGNINYTLPHLRQIVQDGTDEKRTFPIPEVNIACGADCPNTSGSFTGGRQNGMAIRRIPGGSRETTDLALTVSTDNDLAVVGDTVTYAFALTNLGPLDADETVLTFILPPHMTLLSMPGCVDKGTTAVCEYGTLGEGDTLTNTAVLQVESGANGRMVGSAVATTSRNDHLPGNNAIDTVAYFAPSEPVIPPGSVRELYAADQTDFTDPASGVIYRLSGLDVQVIVGQGSAGAVQDIAIDEARNKIYWSDVAGGTGSGVIRQANPDGSGQAPLLSGLNLPTALALDGSSSYLYFADQDRIARLHLTSLTQETVVDGLSNVRSIALDNLRDFLYWSSSGSIYRMELQGNGEREQVLAGLSQFGSFALNPYDGKLYWNKNNYYGIVWQSNLDGSNIRRLADNTRTPDRLWFDDLGDHLYWFEYVSFLQFNYFGIEQAAVGAQSAPFVFAPQFNYPTALNGRYVTPPPAPPTFVSSPVTTTRTGQPYAYRVRATGSQPLTYTLLNPPAGMTLTGDLISWSPPAAGSYAIEVQAQNGAGTAVQNYNLQVVDPPPPTITSPPVTVAEKDVPYSYQAQGTSTGPITWSLASAPAGMSIDPGTGLVSWTPAVTGTYAVEVVATNLGGTTSQHYTVEVYLFAAENQLYWVEAGPVLKRTDLTLLQAIDFYATNLTRIDQMALDRINGHVYWIEGEGAYEFGQDAIVRADLNGANVTPILTNLHSAHGLAVDPHNDALYWSDYLAGSIRRATLDGTNPVTLTAGLTKPVDLELDSWHGRLYWLDGDPDLGEPVSLMSARVDGSDVQTLLTGQGNTRDLALDARNGRLYWAAGAANNVTLYRADYARDGSGITNITPLETGLQQVWGLALKPDESRIYWSNGIADEIWRHSLAGGGSSQLAVTGTGFGLQDVTAVYPYSHDLPLPTAAVISPTNGATINSYRPLTVTGIVTAPAYAREVIVEQQIDGSWTAVYSKTYVTGETAVAQWAFTWTTPTRGYQAVGSHDFRIRVDDWGNGSSLTPFTLNLQPPPTGITLPPDLAPFHLEISSPPNGTTFTSADPITLTAGAAAAGYLSVVTLTEVVSNTALYQGSWAFGEAATATITAVWTPPAASGTYLFIMTGQAHDGATKTITHTVIVDLPPTMRDEPPGYIGPLLDSVVLTPTNGALLPDLGTVTLAGTANARNGLQSVSVRVNGGEVFSNSWANGAVKDATWSTGWTPAADGIYVIDSVVADWAGHVQTETHPITITVDSIGPAIQIDPTVLTSTHQAAATAVLLQGSANGSPGELVEVEIDGGGWQPVAFDGTIWQTEWPVIADGQSFSVQARIIDKAGRSGQDSQSVVVDVLPPKPVNVTLGYLDGTVQPLKAGDTIYDSNPTLLIDWSAGSDGSGISQYKVGWTANPTPDAAALSTYLPADLRQHQQGVADLQILYAHVGTYDAYGNVHWHSIGPVYVDDVQTPDLIADINYGGWRGSGSTLLGADYELFRNAPQSAANNEVQHFFMTWDAAAVRLAWEGADWTYDGDLYVYFDNAPGGSTAAYDPNPGNAITLTLPAENGNALEADYLLRVEDASTVMLLAWDGATWMTAQVLSATHYHMANGLLDVRLPFGWLGMSAGDPLQMVAFATEEDSLHLWAAMPNQNPLNSERVVSELAQGRDLSTFALTQYYEWAALAANLEPNENQLAAADLRVSVTSEPAGVQVGYLQDDLLDLLLPNGRLDADLDGVVDVELPFDTVVIPQGDGQPISYTIIYTNAGTATATAVQVAMDGYGAVDFGGSNSTLISIGDVAPGTGSTIVVPATLNATQDPEAGEMVATLSDAAHTAYDWFWVQHQLDAAAPTGLTIATPVDYALPFTQTIYGLVQDASAIAAVQVEVRMVPTGTITTLNCPDGNRDGFWTCLWNGGSLQGVDTVELRAKATDVAGNESSWTAWRVLAVDLEAPLLTLDTAVDDALADGFLSPGEFLINGSLTDNIEARSIEICLQESEDLTCTSVRSQGTTPTATLWEIDVSNLVEGDGAWQTMILSGRDGVDNLSPTITRTYRVDTIGPMITATQRLTVVNPGDIAGDRTLIQGVVSDGGGVAEVLVRLGDDEGNIYWLNAAIAGNGWAVGAADLPDISGQYWMSVEAIDVAGNVHASGSYVIEINGLQHLYFPIVRK